MIDDAKRLALLFRNSVTPLPGRPGIQFVEPRDDAVVAACLARNALTTWPSLDQNG